MNVSVKPLMPRARSRRCPHAARLQHRGHAAPSRRNRNESHPRRTRRSHSRSSWMERRQRPQRLPKNISLLRLPPRAPELDRKKISGNSCGRTGCRTASSNPSTKSSITAATPGIRSSINRGKSCPSLAAIGQPPVTHCEACYYSSRSCARLRPSPVLARINSRSNSAKPPNTVSVRRPCGLVVSAQTSGVDHEGATRRQQSTSISGKHYPENHKGEGSAPRVWQLPL